LALLAFQELRQTTPVLLEQMERLVPLLYQELRVLAASHLRCERPDHTLQANRDGPISRFLF
jgi:hypothetical protein